MGGGVRDRGFAGCLIALQLTEAAIDGALNAGFAAGELHERVGAVAVGVEGAGQEIAIIGGGGRGRRGITGLLGQFESLGVLLLAGLVAGRNNLEAVAVDAGFHGEDAMEAPLIGGDAQDQIFFGGADGLEAVQVVVEEDEEFSGVLIEEDMLVGAQAVKEAVAAGGGLACGGAWAGGFLSVAAVGFDSGRAGLARFV